MTENKNQKIEPKNEPQNSISESFDWFFESDEKIRKMFQIEKTNYKIETEEWHPFFEISNQDRETIQYIVAAAQTSANDELIKAQIAQINAQIDQSRAQVDQIRSQIELIGYQGVSEQAKYLDVINGKLVEGTIGKQKEIYAAQAKGFKDSALQSVAKTMIDTWSVRRTTDEATLTSPESKLYDGNIGNAIQEMFTSLNIPVASPPSIPAQTLKVGVAYTFDVTPYIVLPTGIEVTAYAVSGTLPAGISFTDGVFKGTPTATGTFLIDVTGTGSGQSITRSVTMNVADAV